VQDTEFDTRGLARDTAILWAAISIIGFAAWRSVLFGQPIYELGDLAANGLQIDSAKRLEEFVGHYSRWGFHHPGPAFLYVYAAGEVVLFDWLDIAAAPHSAHLVFGLILQALFLGFGIAILAHLLALPRRAFLGAGTAVAIAYLGLVDQPLVNLWPPTSLVLPFFLFVISCGALAVGWIALLPVVVGAGSFLVHGHASQPLFVGPLFAAAYVWGRSASLRLAIDRPIDRAAGFLRSNMRSHLAAVVVAAPFMLTLAIDAARGADSNIAQILGSVGRGYHDLADAATFVAIIASFAAPIEGILDVASATASGLEPRPAILLAWGFAIGGMAVVVARARRRDPPDALARRLSTLLVYIAMALALVVLWVVIQAGDMYAFNGWFIYGLLLIVVLVWVGVGARHLRRVAGSTTAAGVGFASLAIVGVATAVASPPANRLYEAGPVFHDAVGRLTAGIPTTRAIYLDYLWAPTWPDVAGVALELHRRGYTFLVPPGHASLVLGEAHAVEAADLPTSYPTGVRWRFVSPGEAAGAMPLTDRLEVIVGR